MSLRRFLRRNLEDADLQRESESDLEHETADNVTRGISREEARRRAQVKLGNPVRVGEELWQGHALGFLDHLIRDLRKVFRTLSRAPGFTLVAVLVIALGIGAVSSLPAVWKCIQRRGSQSLIAATRGRRASAPSS